MDEREKLAEINQAFAELRRLEDRLEAVRKLGQAAGERPEEDPYAGEQRSGNLFDITY